MLRWLKNSKIMSGLASLPWIVLILSALLAGLLGAFTFIMASGNPEGAFRLFGVSDKFRILEFLGIAMGGIVLAIQAAIAYKRARAMEDTAKAQARVTLPPKTSPV